MLKKEHELRVAENSSLARNPADSCTSVRALKGAKGTLPDLSVTSVAAVSAKGRASGAEERIILVGTSDNELLLFSTGAKEVALLHQAHAHGDVSALAAHPSKHLIATTGGDATVRVWGAEERACVALGFPQMDAAKARLTSVEWAPRAFHEHHIAAGTSDGAVAIMVFTAGKAQLQPMPLDVPEQDRAARARGAVTALRYSPDALWLAVGYACGHIDILDTQNAYQYAAVCAPAPTDGPPGAPPPPERAVRVLDWAADSGTLQVPPPLVLSGHAASLTPY